MKPAAFDFHAPEQLDEALALLARHGEDARILAGGQSLVPMMNMRLLQPEVLISINHCRELDAVRVEAGELVVGALARQARVEEDAQVRQDWPLLAEALGYVGGFANRNRGTVCGSLAHADPLAELPAVAVVLDAEMDLASQTGRRRVAARDFFVTDLTTCLESDEMLEAVRFGAPGPREGTAFAEVSNQAHGFAVAGVAARVGLAEDGSCRLAGLAAIGGGLTACRLEAAEQALIGSQLDAEAIDAAARLARDAVEPPEDVHADQDYRRHVIGVLVRRTLAQAHDRARAA